jgi:hypothetical protein
MLMRGGNKGLLGATYGERTMERMSIATWIVCGLVIAEYTIKLQQNSAFAKKSDRSGPNY